MKIILPIPVIQQNQGFSCEFFPAGARHLPKVVNPGLTVFPDSVKQDYDYPSGKRVNTSGKLFHEGTHVRSAEKSYGR
jgi:hypothetical protein